MMSVSDAQSELFNEFTSRLMKEISALMDKRLIEFQDAVLQTERDEQEEANNAPN